MSNNVTPGVGCLAVLLVIFANLVLLALGAWVVFSMAKAVFGL